MTTLNTNLCYNEVIIKGLHFACDRSYIPISVKNCNLFKDIHVQCKRSAFQRKSRRQVFSVKVKNNLPYGVTHSLSGYSVDNVMPLIML